MLHRTTIPIHSLTGLAHPQPGATSSGGRDIRVRAGWCSPYWRRRPWCRLCSRACSALWQTPSMPRSSVCRPGSFTYSCAAAGAHAVEPQAAFAHQGDGEATDVDIHTGRLRAKRAQPVINAGGTILIGYAWSFDPGSKPGTATGRLETGVPVPAISETVRYRFSSRFLATPLCPLSTFHHSASIYYQMACY